MKYNPFSRVIGEKNARFAPTLRTTYGEKVTNCFRVLMGKDEQLGIIDWLTGMLLRDLITLAALLSSLNHSTTFPFFLKPVTYLLWTVLAVAAVIVLLATVVISFCLTAAAALTIIPVVHLISSLIAPSSVRQVVLDLVDENKMTLGAFLEREERELSDLQVEGNAFFITKGRVHTFFHPVPPVDEEETARVDNAFKVLGLTDSAQGNYL